MIIPLFPLPLVVFPGERMPLHIFEERYKLMISRCIELMRTAEEPVLFGICSVTDEKLAEIGCAVTIEEIAKRYDDGRMDIVTRGERRFRQSRIIRDEAYLQVEAEFFDDFVEVPDRLLLDKTVALHCKLLEVAGKKYDLPEDLSGTPGPSFRLAHGAGLDLAERQRLLEVTSENARLKSLTEYYKRVIPVALENENLRKRILANGFFRKLRSIQI